nr:hypothetical protein [Tanacetum cinerariifolium]
MDQQSCSYCGGPFNGGNYLSCSIVGAGNEFVHDPNPFPYDNTPDFYDQTPQHHVETYSCELCGTILTMIMIAANLSTHTPEPSRHFNSICYDDNDDDKEKTIPLRDIISQLSSSIVITTSPPVLPIEDPEDSLIMGNEELRTILEKESDKVKKSSVEDFVPIPSKFEDTSRNDSEYDLP